MKKATKFVAECGGSFGGGSCGSGPISSGSASSMSDFELENALHSGQRWEGNMVCGHWVGTSKASAEVKKEYQRRIKQREAEREAEYKRREAEYQRRRKADLARLQKGLKTTKQSFEQEVWRQFSYDIESTISTISYEIREIPKKVKKYNTLLAKWSKIKGYSKERIDFGKKIVEALQTKLEALTNIHQQLKDGEGKWWNVSIDIEGGKKFLI